MSNLMNDQLLRKGIGYQDNVQLRDISEELRI